MESIKYRVSDAFYSLLFRQEDVEPLLIADHNPPLRLFVTKYIVGSDGETSRLIFRSELTGYDYEQQITYPTQKRDLDSLQHTLEAFAYSSFKSDLSRAEVESAKGNVKAAKMIISNELVSEIITLYRFAW